MYIGTILISILFLLVISLIIYAWIKDKAFDYFFLLLFVLAIGLFIISGVYRAENNAVKYPYNKNSLILFLFKIFFIKNTFIIIT